MKPWRTWLACLGVLGALAIISGCGGGDVPDPSADGPSAALPESAPPPPPGMAPAPALATPKVAAREERTEDAATEVAAAPAEPPPAAEKPAPAGPGAGGNAAPGDRGSATAEMLALATKEPPPAPAAGGDSAAENTPAPGTPPAAGGGPGDAAGMQGQMQAMQQQRDMMKNMQANMQANMRAQGGAPGGGPGMPGAGGSDNGPGGNNEPADFRSPRGAVQAFLNALKARDLNRLNEATALRAQNESSPRYRDMFKRIFDLSLSESDLNALATKLEGYYIASENQAKSTGRLDIVLMKVDQPNNAGTGVSGGGAYYHLKVTVRREKKGWGVCDIGTPTEFKNQAIYNPYAKKKR